MYIHVLWLGPSLTSPSPLPPSLSQDYHWWWRSFFLSGSASYYVMAYSLIYYYTKVDNHGSVMLLWCHMTSHGHHVTRVNMWYCRVQHFVSVATHCKPTTCMYWITHFLLHSFLPFLFPCLFVGPSFPLFLPLPSLQLEIANFISTMLYFGYTLVMVVGFWLLTGTIGFYATYFFICKIYGAVKQD